ncbi:glycosyltransferase family 2 protein [Microvirga alba]|uniref:Glycosyltransferase family 2 protein n=1 Tax=Microvirga alba TaxID=2791025 RepID=A0A931BQZ2_9HYPH|nr:glycosyltransferase family 2 protein [Microvirga alba]MBF9234418.1 glycosyltransferase family 2 protein [Microvirga alba]
MINDLVRIDTRRLNGSAGQHSVFMVVRNERARLPYHLTYHRALGVDRFFLVDNGSDDGTTDFLLSQPDCHVFQTFAPFGSANYGMDWVNALVERFGIGSWCLFLDADELFTFPHAEFLSLPEFCRFLDETGSEGVFALLLDMYNRGPISEAIYRPGTPFLTTCPHFDPGYTIRRKISLSRGESSFAEVEAVGGPRLRRFYPEFQRAGVWRMALHRALRRLRRHPLGAAFGLRHTRLGGAMPPDLTKIPLLKGRAGRHWVSNHRCTPLKLSGVRSALLHFKFFSDFHDRSISEATRGQHWDGGAEYVRYSSLLAGEPGVSLFFDRSATYRSNDELVRLGIMKSTSSFDAFAHREYRRTLEGVRQGEETAASQRFGFDDGVTGRLSTQISDAFGGMIAFPRRSQL